MADGNVEQYLKVGSWGDWEAGQWPQTEGLNLSTSCQKFLFFEHCHWTSYLLTTVTCSGMGPSVCAHWTMADHCGHMGEQQARQTFVGEKWTFFRAGVSREHRVESPIYVLFNPWLPEDPTHMPRFSIVKIFTANCFQWKREGWVPDGGGGKDLRRDSFETSRQVFSNGLNDVFIKLQLSRPWVYGQFSPTVLPAVCHLLHTSPYLRPAERANPVKVCSTFPTNWKHKPWFWKTNMNSD